MEENGKNLNWSSSKKMQMSVHKGNAIRIFAVFWNRRFNAQKPHNMY